MKKNTTRFSRIMSLGVLGLTAAYAYGVTAKPGIITAMQPDGTSVSLRLEGNQSYNRAYSTDGYLLTVDENGFYVFATLDSEGNLTASAYRADTPATRNQATINFLASVDKTAIVKAMDNHKVVSNYASRTRRSIPAVGAGRFNDSYPVFGEQRALVLLVEFADNEFTSTDNPREYFNRMLNEQGFSDNDATGSARDYFIENSNGVFTPIFDVFGPVKLENDMEYYGAHAGGANDRRPERIITDACKLIDEEVDFSLYDCDGDGVIDNVYVFYAGMGEASGGGNNTIWPHSAFLTDISKKKYTFDELLLDRYACSNELEVSKETVGIGTFVHEFSHVLGLPDIYSTGYTGAFTPGGWSCIDNGNYNNNGHTPPYYSAFERYALGWLQPKVLDTPGDYTLDRIHTSNEAFIIPTDREEEFYLFENRQQEGLDTYIPGHGLVVWHIDFDEAQWLSNTVNNDANHQHVDLVEADNILTDKSRSGDSFPGERAITSFTPATTPALTSWNNEPLGFGLYDITEGEDGSISFSLRSEGNGIRQTTSEGKVLVSVSGCLVRISNPDVIVYDFSGSRMNPKGIRTFLLTPGIYVATDGHHSKKFIIR